MNSMVLIAIFAVGFCLDLGGCVLLLRELGKSAREHTGESGSMKYMIMMAAGLACMALAVFGGYNW